MTLCISGHAYAPAFVQDFRRPAVVAEFDRVWDEQLTWGRTTPQNNELQWYVANGDRTDNGELLDFTPFVFSPSGLSIRAVPTPERLKSYASGLPYLSGVITTRSHFAQTFGYFEIRARMPEGQGLWPAFWLLPLRGYPPEIDVVEVLGGRPDVVHETVHLPNDAAKEFTVSNLKTSTAVHAYGVEWTKEGLAFTIDRRVTHRVAAIIAQPMYMLVNLAVGGWAGVPDNSSAWPAVMTVESVGAYRPAEDSACPPLQRAPTEKR